jgi:hypothetical protein
MTPSRVQQQWRYARMIESRYLDDAVHAAYFIEMLQVL